MGQEVSIMGDIGQGYPRHCSAVPVGRTCTCREACQECATQRTGRRNCTNIWVNVNGVMCEGAKSFTVSRRIDLHVNHLGWQVSSREMCNVIQ